MLLNYNKILLFQAKNNISQTQLLKNAKISPNTLTRIKTNKKVLPTTINRISKALNVDVSELIKED